VDPAGRPRVELLAVTKAITSVAPDHPELDAAHEAGIHLVSCQQLIADAAATRGLRTLAAAGTHGKSTTSGWIVHLLAEAGLDPTAFVGALLPVAMTAGHPTTVRIGVGRDFVVEADEYAGNFDPFRPAIAVVLNADWDHPDVFADRAAVVDAFERWVRRFDGGGEAPVLAANVGDLGVRELVARLPDWPGRLVAFEVVLEGATDPTARLASLAADLATAAGPAAALVATLRIGDAGVSHLVMHGLPGLGPTPVTLRLVGRHCADDALGAAAVALAAGVEPASVVAGLASFEGVGRRFELKGDVAGVVVLDDYGHHPTAIATTLEAVRLKYPGRRVWAVYEPLTYHRTAVMLEQFADVLATADRVAIAEIFAVRDPDTTITSAQALADAVNRRGRALALSPGTVEETADVLAPLMEPGDVVLVMGGGKSHILAERLVDRLAGRNPDAPAG
jgi:UDP-N-acetylmuramate--alanine ligase